MKLRDEEKDRLECLRLAVIFANAGAKPGTARSDDVIVVAEKFYQFTRKQ
jgi:hypothetical protein